MAPCHLYFFQLIYTHIPTLDPLGASFYSGTGVAGARAVIIYCFIHLIKGVAI